MFSCDSSWPSSKGNGPEKSCVLTRSQARAAGAESRSMDVVKYAARSDAVSIKKAAAEPLARSWPQNNNKCLVVYAPTMAGVMIWKI